MGKSLFISQKCNELDNLTSGRATPSQKDRFNKYETVVRTPVHGTSVCYEDVVLNLSKGSICDVEFPRVYHFDIAPTVCFHHYFFILKK